MEILSGAEVCQSCTESPQTPVGDLRTMGSSTKRGSPSESGQQCVSSAPRRSGLGRGGASTEQQKGHLHGDLRFQRFQHCKVSPKLPVLPTNPAGPLPSAEAAGTGVDGWDEPCPPGSSGGPGIPQLVVDLVEDLEIPLVGIPLWGGAHNAATLLAHFRVRAPT